MRARPIVVNRNKRYHVSRNPFDSMRVKGLPEDEVFRIINEGIESHNRNIADVLAFVRPTFRWWEFR